MRHITFSANLLLDAYETDRLYASATDYLNPNRQDFWQWIKHEDFWWTTDNLSTDAENMYLNYLISGGTSDNLSSSLDISDTSIYFIFFEPHPLYTLQVLDDAIGIESLKSIKLMLKSYIRGVVDEYNKNLKK